MSAIEWAAVFFISGCFVKDGGDRTILSLTSVGLVIVWVIASMVGK